MLDTTSQCMFTVQVLTTARNKLWSLLVLTRKTLWLSLTTRSNRRWRSRRRGRKISWSWEGNLAEERLARQTVLRWKVLWGRRGICRGELRPGARLGRPSQPGWGSRAGARRWGGRRAASPEEAGWQTSPGRSSARPLCQSQSSWWDLKCPMAR